MAPVENEKAVMLQLREIGGKMVDLSFSSDIVNIKKVEVCDVVGETVKGEQAALKLKPWESKFIKIYW